jgi:hypothetical protein
VTPPLITTLGDFEVAEQTTLQDMVSEMEASPYLAHRTAAEIIERRFTSNGQAIDAEQATHYANALSAYKKLFDGQELNETELSQAQGLLGEVVFYTFFSKVAHEIDASIKISTANADMQGTDFLVVLDGVEYKIDVTTKMWTMLGSKLVTGTSLAIIPTQDFLHGQAQYNGFDIRGVSFDELRHALGTQLEELPLLYKPDNLRTSEAMELLYELAEYNSEVANQYSTSRRYRRGVQNTCNFWETLHASLHKKLTSENESITILVNEYSI